ALFYANIPVPQIIEMHMEIIDEFAKQLRLEGRSDETLLDYRLTLIDILAHLCEIYRSTVAKIN
ncbi:MAG: KaiA family protein, partial [Dolichospermum sp.]